MGVLALWQLLKPVGQPVSLETLENKILAVDVSIWLNQALKGFRDAEGNAVPNAHLLGIFHRICKLLHYKIKPIFVFDGAPPLLKKQTLAARQERKRKAAEESHNTNKHILVNFINQHLAQKIDLSGSSPPKRKAGAGRPNNECDLFKLPSLPEEIINEGSNEEDVADDSFLESHFQHPSQIDVDSPDFQSLPPEIRHEILLNMKEYRKRTWSHVSEMPKQSEDFSNYQMKRLLGRRKLQKDIEDVRKEISHRHAEEYLLEMYDDPLSSEVQKIASDDSSHYMLITGIKPQELKEPELSVTNCESKSTPENKNVILTAPEVICLENNNEGVSASDVLVECETIKLLNNFPKKTKEIIVVEKSSEKNVNPEAESMPKNKNVIVAAPEVIWLEKNKEAISASDMLMECETTKIWNNIPKNAKEINIVGDVAENNINPEVLILGEQKSQNLINNMDNKTKGDCLITSSLASVLLKVPDNDSEETKQKDESEDSQVKCTQLIKESDFTKEQNYKRVAEKESAIDMARINSTQNKDSTEIVKEISSKNFQQINSQETTVKALEVREVVHDETISNRNEQTLLVQEHGPKSVQFLKNQTNVPAGKSSPLQVTVDPRSVSVPDDLFPADIFLPSTSTSKQTNQDEVIQFTQNIEDRVPLNLEDLQQEEQRLLQERAKLERQAASVTDQMHQEAQDLLRLFGIPFVASPAEAEAQCAQLEMTKLSQGTITDDSDIWPFGGSLVYKNFFTQDKYVESYDIKNIAAEFGLSHNRLICFAMLTGSDYTEGLYNVGHVTAMEILGEFPGDGLEALQSFREWWDSVQRHEQPAGTKTRNSFRKLTLNPGFPNPIVYDAYRNPEVDKSEEKFSWGTPDLQSLREFTEEKFGWNRKKTDDILLPVMKRVAERQIQMKLDSFFTIGLKREKNLFPSKRLKKAVTKIRTKGRLRIPNLSESSSSSDVDDPSPE